MRRSLFLLFSKNKIS